MPDSGVPRSRRRIRVLLAALIAIVVGVVVAHFVPKPWPEISRQEFLIEVRSGHLHEVEIQDGETIFALSSTRGHFWTAVKPSDKELIAELLARGIKILYSSSGPTP